MDPGTASGVTDWNWLSLVLVLLLFGIWNLELVATMLDRKSEPREVPEVLRGTMTQEELERGRAYRTERAKLAMVRTSCDLAILLVFWSAGGFGWLDDWVRQSTGGGIATGLMYLGVWYFGRWLIDLPFEIRETFVLEQQFGFNRATVSTFVTDRLKGLLLVIVLGGGVAAALLWILESVEHAWLWAWVVLAGVQCLMVWLAPTWIMPLFNRFSPMEEGDLKRDIEELGRICGFPLEGVFVMDGSKRSTKANAFFTGIGRHKKIALFDTLIGTCGRDEILAVLAHEIGHFRCGHVRSRLMAGMLNLGAMCFLLGACTDADGTAARVVFDAFGVPTVSAHVGLVLFGILMSPVSSLIGVGLHAWSRRHEFEADAFARRVIGTGTPLMEALCRMTKDHLAHPTPSRLRVWLDHSHPPLIERLGALQAPKPG